MDFISSCFRGLINFESGSWIVFFASIGIICFLLYWRRQNQYILEVGYKNHKRYKESAKSAWEHDSHRIDFVSLLKIYVHLAQLDYKPINDLNTEFKSRILNFFDSTYLGEKSLNALLAIREMRYKILTHGLLLISFDAEAKINAVDDFLRKLTWDLITSFNNRLEVPEAAAAIFSAHSYEELKQFSDKWKHIGVVDEYKDSPRLNFLTCIKDEYPELYAKMNQIHDFVNSENTEKRYKACLEMLLDFPDIVSLPEYVQSFDSNVKHFCGEDYVNNPDIESSSRKAISKRLLHMVDELTHFNGLKNFKQLFEILGEYLAPQDAADLFLDKKS